MLGRLTLCGLAALAAVATTRPAQAGAIVDPAGDFLSTFTGTRSGELDVLSAFATFDGTTFHLGATVNGTIGTLPSDLYVWGVNRGAPTSSFASIGLPAIAFDGVITLTGSGTLGGLGAAGSGSTARISGNSFTIDIPLSALPSRGFTPQQYEFNLWPRDSAVAAGTGQISDFAPNDRNFAVPEPASAAALGAGLLALAGLRRRRA